jgi:hypothetical protein
MKRYTTQQDAPGFVPHPDGCFVLVAELDALAQSWLEQGMRADANAKHPPTAVRCVLEQASIEVRIAVGRARAALAAEPGLERERVALAKIVADDWVAHHATTIDYKARAREWADRFIAAYKAAPARGGGDREIT